MSLVLVGRWPFLLLNREQACLFAPIMQAVGWPTLPFPRTFSHKQECGSSAQLQEATLAWSVDVMENGRWPIHLPEMSVTT